MAQTFKCKFCGKRNEVSEALAQQVKEKVLADERVKHQAELLKVRNEVQEQVGKKIKSEFELTVKKLQAAEADERERNKKFQDQILDLGGELRKARQEREDAKIEAQKKLAQEEEKIRQKATKKAQEENQLKNAERDKQFQDVLKVNEDLKRKLQQGSQQTQGEVLELELEDILKKEFPNDIIKEVKKGQRGADVVQEVIDKQGRNCGTILWESKNAKWSQTWLSKLKQDQRAAKAHLAVLLVSNPPDDIKTFTYREGVWIATRKMIVPLALVLRFDLVHINHERSVDMDKGKKAEVLYKYITSVEFKHRMEAIAEAFGNFQDEMEREKRWFQTKWARQEKQLRKVIDNTHGMYGDLQGVIGQSLPDIKTLELESGEGG